MPGKREDYTSWDEYFMGEAVLASTRSKDPHNQIGACIVDEETNEILSSGYNVLPKGMDDDLFDWTSSGEITGDEMNIKNNYVIHAELNAILKCLHGSKSLLGKTLYVTWFPCNLCAANIAQVGIKKVVYLRMYSKPINIAISKRILDAAGIEYVPYNKERDIEREEFDAAVKTFQKVLKGFRR